MLLLNPLYDTISLVRTNYWLCAKQAKAGAWQVLPLLGKNAHKAMSENLGLGMSFY